MGSGSFVSAISELHIHPRRQHPQKNRRFRSAYKETSVLGSVKMRIELMPSAVEGGSVGGGGGASLVFAGGVVTRITHLSILARSVRHEHESVVVTFGPKHAPLLTGVLVTSAGNPSQTRGNCIGGPRPPPGRPGGGPGGGESASLPMMRSILLPSLTMRWRSRTSGSVNGPSPLPPCGGANAPSRCARAGIAASTTARIRLAGPRRMAGGRRWKRVILCIAVAGGDSRGLTSLRFPVEGGGSDG
jgi:hypothetical protein